MRVQQGRDESMRTGYLDMQGTTVIAPDWEDGTNFSDGWAAVQRDGKWGYIDPNGQVVMQPVYAHAYAPRGDYLIVVYVYVCFVTKLDSNNVVGVVKIKRSPCS